MKRKTEQEEMEEEQQEIKKIRKYKQWNMKEKEQSKYRENKLQKVKITITVGYAQRIHEIRKNKNGISINRFGFSC